MKKVPTIRASWKMRSGVARRNVLRKRVELGKSCACAGRAGASEKRKTRSQRALR